MYDLLFSTLSLTFGQVQTEDEADRTKRQRRNTYDLAALGMCELLLATGGPKG